MVLILLIGLLLVPVQAGVSDYQNEIETWRRDRITRLTSDSGWLTLIGLFWLQEGAQTLGSDPASDILLPADRAPARVGTLTLTGAGTRIRVADGVEVRCRGTAITEMDLRSDADGEPDILEMGSLSLYVIQRGTRHALRVKDRDSAARRGFHGIETWPADPGWRVEARFEPFAAQRRIRVPTAYGEVENMDAPGVAIFSVGGREHRLMPVLEKGEHRLFFIFGDATNGTESYGAGRFLYAEPPVDGRLVLDFNQAYNPPCVFTPYATCPLPPSGNRLDIRVEAGEKKYGDH